MSRQDEMAGFREHKVWARWKAGGLQVRETWKICRCSRHCSPCSRSYKTPDVGLCHEDSGVYDWLLVGYRSTRTLPVDREQKGGALEILYLVPESVIALRKII